MRFHVERDFTFGGSRRRGFGIQFHWGSLGYTAGEPGQNMFLEIQIGIWRLYNINLTWKKL